MKEKELLRICNALKSITLKPIIWNEIKVELLDVKRAKHLPDTDFPRHHHPWFEFNYFSAGTFETSMGGKTFLCQKNQALLIPPGAVHAQKSGSSGDDGICMRWQISPAKDEVSDAAYRFLEALNTPHPEGLDVNIKILSGLGEHSDLNSCVFLHFLLSIYCRWQKNPEPHAPKQLISNQAILYMEEYLQTPMTAMDIARALNMSYRTLARSFKKETGVSIIEKLTELRINKARRLLAETDLPVSKIAEEVGFENIYYFSNIFKKYMRVSPNQFRKMQ